MYALNENHDKMKLLKELCKNNEVITFKSIEQEFHTRYHFGNVEGMNHLHGKNLDVVGLPNLDETVYCLYGMRAGAVIQKSAMYPQRIVYRDKSFYLNTYKNQVLQMIQTWLISSQLEQAVGRARLLREDCTVTVFCWISRRTGELS